VALGSRILAAPVALALALATTSACSGTPEENPAPPRPKYRMTIANADVGEQLTITAGVHRCLSGTSFVVRDADLPVGGLLVLAREPVEVWYPVLVTLTGSVVMFRYADFAPAALGPSVLYGKFEGRKAIRADEVRVWADATEPSNGSEPSPLEEGVCGPRTSGRCHEKPTISPSRVTSSTHSSTRRSC
jgi:hypothetical protein